MHDQKDAMTNISYTQTENDPTNNVAIVLAKQFSTSVRYRSFPNGGLVRQALIFESAPSISKSSLGKRIALVELCDGRAYFFRTGMAVLEDLEGEGLLVEELIRLPEWITDWKGASERVGYFIGASLEFIDKAPDQIESWNISEWKKHTMSWAAINQPELSFQQVGQTTSAAAEILRVELSSQIESFLSRLDRVACSLSENAKYSWQASYNYFVPVSEQQRLYRRQAITTFPLVVQYIHACPKDESGSSIRLAIDAGIPLVGHLSKLFNCSKATVRHLNGIRLDQIGIRWVSRFKELLMVLTSLDVNRLPVDGMEWKAFGETVDLLTSMTKLPISSVSSRLLLGELSRLKWDRKHNPSVSFQERALAIERFTENIRISIVATAWTNGKDVSVSGMGAQRIAAEVACSLGLSRLEKLARKWNSEQMRLGSAFHHLKNNKFPALLDEPLAAGEFKIIQLTEHKQLDEESIRMGNCVSSYVGACASGMSFIFSIRDQCDKSRVTVEYKLSRSKTGLPELVLIQQKGFENTSPSGEYYGALNALHNRLKSPDTKRRILSLAVFQKAMEKGGVDMAKRYLCSLEFITFLQEEASGRFDFERLAADSVSQEVVHNQSAS